MNKVLYYMGLISEVLFLIMTLFLLPLILKTGFSGFFFLITVLIFILLRLFMIVSKTHIVKEEKIYSILMIVLTFYLGIIFTRILLVYFFSSSIYELSMTYCRNNFFLVALTMVCIILNTIVLCELEDDRKRISSKKHYS